MYEGFLYLVAGAMSPPPPLFESLRFGNNSQHLPMVPGPDLYSAVVINQKNATKATEKTSIFSTSVAKNINRTAFRKEYEGQAVFFHPYPGGKMRHIQEYMKVHMKEETPDNVVIVGGGNDLSGDENIQRTATHIIDAGVVAKTMGATRVLIAGVLPRREYTYQLRRHDLNKLLKDLCTANGFTFIDTGEFILREHISDDNVHLNNCGTQA